MFQFVGHHILKYHYLVVSPPVYKKTRLIKLFISFNFAEGKIHIDRIARNRLVEIGGFEIVPKTTPTLVSFVLS